MPTLDTVITLLMLAGGTYALGSMAWSKWGLGAFVMSIAGRLRAMALIARLPDTYQVEPPANQVVLSGSELVPNRDADIAYLAQRREPDGAYTYSANKIADLVGGTRTETLAKIRAARGEPDPAQPAKRTIPLRRNGQEELLEVDW